MSRLADEVKELAKHGVMVKPELQGLLPDQIKACKERYIKDYQFI